MMKTKIFNYLSGCALMVLATLSFTSCSEDKLGPTIFPDVTEEIDPNSATYQLDMWLKENFRDVYNVEFQYKYEDVGTNMNYNLLPARYDKALDIAVLTKYLWFDVYAEVTGSQEFLKTYGPRILMLVGSPAYNPSSGTILLGLAEGGIKVTLFRVNEARIDNFADLNEYLFRTMHHEFAHILHQTKSIPKEFQTISNAHYDSSNWQNRNAGVVNSLGFVTPYASSEMREDYAEIIANYITRTQEEWDHILLNASRGWATDAEDANDEDAVYYCFYYYDNNDASNPDNLKYLREGLVGELEDGTLIYKNNYQKGVAPITKDSEGNRVDANGNRCDNSNFVLDSNGKRIPIKVFAVLDEDGVDGVAIINQKLQIARTWFKEEWGIDLEQLRNEVQYRQLNYDIEALRQQVYNIK